MSPGRAPRGARGLKPVSILLALWVNTSRPTRGAWIETETTGSDLISHPVAPHAGRVD